MRHRGVCAWITCRQRTTSLPDARLWQCYTQWTALKAMMGVQITTTCNEMTVSMEPSIAESAPSDAVPCPAFDSTDDERARLHALLNQYDHGFTQNDLDLGYTEAVQHRIPTSDDAPVAQPYRSIPPNQLQEVKEHIKGLLAQRDIVESHSPYAAPVVLVRKKDGSLRLCVDYRRLNLKTVGDAYPLPRIQESLDALVGAQYFSTLDLASGYHQISMDPRDQHKTAITTPFALYEHTRMPMGLASAPATFQRLMQATMSDCLSVSACLPRRPPCLLQDVRRINGAPRTTPAAGDRDRSETESQQVPVPEAWSHLSWPHDLGWWSGLRVWQGGVCAELANTNNDNRAAQLSWLCQLLAAVHQRVCQDCRAAPWPGKRRGQALQEEGLRIQALGPQAPRGLRLLEGGYDNSSCTWLRWLHQALHLGDRCQPWRAQRHPVPGTRWEVKSACLCQPAPPTQWEKQFTLQQYEAGISCHEMGSNGQIPALPVGRKVQGHHRQQSADLLSLRETRRVGAKMGLTARTVRFWHTVQTWEDQPCWCPFPHAPRTLSWTPPDSGATRGSHCQWSPVRAAGCRPHPHCWCPWRHHGSCAALDKEDEPDQTVVPEAATEVQQQQDPVLGPVLAAWPAKPSDTKERSMRALVQQYPRLLLKKEVLHRRQADQGP